jgi:glycine/D-amino acid oxidase-like deaminating enzyme
VVKVSAGTVGDEVRAYHPVHAIGDGVVNTVMSRDASWYRTRSLWLDTVDDDLTPRPSLPGDTAVDVCIVGAGYTGLWTALHLLDLDPAMRVTVVEAEIAGFGASGRNGGWCSSFLPMSLDRIESGHGRDAAIAMHRAMQDTVDEVGRSATAEGIDCHYVKSGTLTLATQPMQLRRLDDEHDEARRFGVDEGTLRLDRAQTRARVAADGVLGGFFTPHCATIHPARLVRGLARAVERRGGVIHEHTRARTIEPGRVATDHGVVRADVVVRATEGYTAALPGERRRLAPIYSLMIATEPLPQSVWDEIGWADRCTLDEARHMIVYAQRTADGRIAFGGRGAPYHFGSRVEDSFDRDERVFALLRRSLVQLFPSLMDVAITHRWGGTLGAPRDWHASVGFDKRGGLAWAGGYVGDGVAATNLAGRTLAHLVTGIDSPLVRLPWVGHESPRWEPEPFRWLGINGALRLPVGADEYEARTGRPSHARLWLLHKLTGR